MERAFRYAEMVESGEILTNNEIKLAVKRFRKDLETYELREDEAEKAIVFTEMLRFSKGRKAGQRIVWEDWQVFILVNIFGFYDKTDGTRRYRYLYLEVARKNGKSTFLAAIALTFLVIFDEAVPEIYLGASTEKQAMPVFKEMSRMVKKFVKEYREKEEEFAVFLTKIEYAANDGLVSIITSNTTALDGENPFCTVLDEVHAHKNADMFNVMKSGMGARDNNTPIIFLVTTAGFSLTSFAYSIRKNFLQVLEGSKVNENTMIMIYTLDPEDDYNDKRVWCKANPSINAAVSMKYLEDEYIQAQNFSSQENNFLTKNLNIWVGGAQTWISRQVLDENDGRALTDEEIEEGRIYLGLDLGLIRDISALCQLTVFDDNRLHVKMRYYMSEDAYRRFISRGIPMDIRRREGVEINVNPGTATDTKVIISDIKELDENRPVERFLFDRWGVQEIIRALEDEGVFVEGVGQGYASQSESISYIERAMHEHRFVLEDDLMLKWMFSNVVLDMNPSGDRKLNKDKADDKIDGISALCNSVYGFINLDGGLEDQSHGIRTVRIG
jgi:phage terminase large subunit-like protein